MTAATLPMSADPEMVTILRAYNEVAEKLKHSHEALFQEVQRLRGELQAKNRELQRRERLVALGEMAAGVAHEIRNPLGGIGLYASLLERDLSDRPAQQDISRRITAGVQNLEAIVRDILAFAGGAEPAMIETRVGAVIDAGVDHARALLESLEIAIEVDHRLGFVDICCDPSQLSRAIANLVFNAIDAVGRGGNIWIRPAALQDDSVSIAVEDNGPGIDPAILHRIFNPFFTTKDRGTGLGLSIVHGIVEAHGGSVSAGQRSAGGASFVLTLPRATERRSGPQRERNSEMHCADSKKTTTVLASKSNVHQAAGRRKHTWLVSP